jgi:hypothetical protein
MPEMEFVILNNVLMVRQSSRIESTFTPLGKPKGWGTSVTFRPATLEETTAYREQKRLNANS